MIDLTDKIIKVLVLLKLIICGAIGGLVGAFLFRWIKSGGLQIFARLWSLDFEVKIRLLILALVAVIASVKIKDKHKSWLLNKEYEEMFGGKE